MNFLDAVEALSLEAVYPKGMAQLVSVYCDQFGVRIRTNARLALRWNQRFSWAEIDGACRVQGGGDLMDVLFIDLRDREPARMPMQAFGAEEFCLQLLGRGVPLAARQS